MRIPIARKNFIKKSIKILIAPLKNYWLSYLLKIKGFEYFDYNFTTSLLNIIIKKHSLFISIRLSLKVLIFEQLNNKKYNYFSIKNKFI